MSGLGTGGRLCVLGSVAALGLPFSSHPADARGGHRHHHRGYHSAYVSPSYGERAWHHGYMRVSYAMHHSYRGLQCVPFARDASGIALTGNALTWWHKAAGVYARGNQPEEGAVLNFRARGGMRLGHVAVVTSVVNSRQIEIDHAHWGGWGVKRNISVIDVSPENDWTEVRVALAHAGAYGSIYPTYGFIYARPPGDEPRLARVLPVTAYAGVKLATAHSAAQTQGGAVEEVAEASNGPRHIVLNLGGLTASPLR